MAVPTSGSTERRAWPRYPITTWAECRETSTQNAGRIFRSRVVNLSTKGAMLESDAGPAPGTRIEMCVNWPGNPAVQLYVTGEAVRCNGAYIGVRIDTSFFRIRPTAG